MGMGSTKALVTALRGNAGVQAGADVIGSVASTVKKKKKKLGLPAEGAGAALSAPTVATPARKARGPLTY